MNGSGKILVWKRPNLQYASDLDVKRVCMSETESQQMKTAEHTDKNIGYGSLTVPTREVILNGSSVFDQVEPIKTSTSTRKPREENREEHTRCFET